MIRSFCWFSKTTVISFFALWCLLLPQLSPAQVDEEMDLLRMYYREEELVVSATRHPKPISQVAENMTVVTADDIEAMNAHTVAEVLNRVPGVFISFNQDFGTASQVRMQGSDPRHVLVLVDGVSWNLLNSGAAETNSIPVGIIDRIEIIEGPGSSAWGSSLGGVINIITKPVGVTTKPTGAFSIGYGERNTQDYRAEAAGKAGKVGYYLYSGYQQSNGLRKEKYTLGTGKRISNGRDFDSPYLYGKLSLPVSARVDVAVSMGYSEPENDLGYYISVEPSISTESVARNFFVNSSIDADLRSDLSLNVDVHYLKQKTALMADQLDSVTLPRLNPNPPPFVDTNVFPGGSLIQDDIYQEDTIGGSAKLVWSADVHTAVFGFDYDYGELDQTTKVGPLLQYVTSSPSSAEQKSSPDRIWWALYANDTIVFGDWTITPGIRFDYNDITDSFLSPSLGLTYQVAQRSLIRASVARGFTVPPLAWTDGGGLFLEPNSGLDNESVWSYQAGIESSVRKYVWIKGSVFLHDIDDTIEAKVADELGLTRRFENGNSSRRQGFELKMETLTFHHFSLAGGLTYVDFSPSNENGTEYLYEGCIGLRYNDEKSFRAELFGHYVWWDLHPENDDPEARYSDIIWDVNLAKKVYSAADRSAEVFFTGHNLLNSSQYELSDSKNPRRWVEGGVRFKF